MRRPSCFLSLIHLFWGTGRTLHSLASLSVTWRSSPVRSFFGVADKGRPSVRPRWQSKSKLCVEEWPSPLLLLSSSSGGNAVWFSPSVRPPSAEITLYTTYLLPLFALSPSLSLPPMGGKTEGRASVESTECGSGSRKEGRVRSPTR